MKPAKAMTIRLSADQAQELETVATVDNQPVSEVIRAAIAEHIESRRKDADFRMGSGTGSSARRDCSAINPKSRTGRQSSRGSPPALEPRASRTDVGRPATTALWVGVVVLFLR